MILKIEYKNNQGNYVTLKEDGNGSDIEIHEFTYTAQRMGDAPNISLSLWYPRCLDNEFNDDWRVKFRDEYFYLRLMPNSSKKNTKVGYDHSLVFVSGQQWLSSTLFIDYYIPNQDEHRIVSNNGQFNFFGTLNQVCAAITTIINQRFDYLNVSSVTTDRTTEEKFVSVENLTFKDLFDELFNIYGVPYFVKYNSSTGKYSVHFKESDGEYQGGVLKYGVSNELLSIEKSNNTKELVNCATGLGGSQNLPYYYPNKHPEGELTGEIFDINETSRNVFINVDSENPNSIKLSSRDYVVYKSYDASLFDEANYVFSTNGFFVPQHFTENNEEGRQHGIINELTGEPRPYNYDGVTMYWIPNYCNNLTLTTDNFIGEAYNVRNSESYTTFQYTTPNGAHVNIEERIRNGWLNVAYNKLHNVATYYFKKEAGTMRFSFNFRSNELKNIGLNGNFVAYVYCFNEHGSKIHFASIPDANNMAGNGSVYRLSQTNIYANGYDDIAAEHLPANASFFSVTIGFCGTEEEFAALYETEEAYNAERFNYSDSYTFFRTQCKVRVATATNRWSLNGTRTINLDTYGIEVADTEYVPTIGDKIVLSVIENSYIPYSSRLVLPQYITSRGSDIFLKALNNTYSGFEFQRPYTNGKPRQAYFDHEEIIPTIKGITNIDGNAINMIKDVYYNPSDTDNATQEGESLVYRSSYFFVQLHKFEGFYEFNLFEHAVAEDAMTIEMITGNCGSCKFKIKVNNANQNMVKVDSFGNLVTDANGNVVFNSVAQDCQNDTIHNNVWLCLEKDTSTFGTIMPNVTNNCKVLANDKFVLTNIRLPQAFITKAQDDLQQAVLADMQAANNDTFAFAIKFSKIYCEENKALFETLTQNSRVALLYNNAQINLLIDTYTYNKKADSVLPDIEITISDTLKPKKPSIYGLINAIEAAERIDLTNLTASNLPRVVNNNLPNNVLRVNNGSVRINGDVYATRSIQTGGDVVSNNENINQKVNSALNLSNVNYEKKRTETLSKIINADNIIVGGSLEEKDVYMPTTEAATCTLMGLDINVPQLYVAFEAFSQEITPRVKLIDIRSTIDVRVGGLSVIFDALSGGSLHFSDQIFLAVNTYKNVSGDYQLQETKLIQMKTDLYNASNWRRWSFSVPSTFFKYPYYDVQFVNHDNVARYFSFRNLMIFESDVTSVSNELGERVAVDVLPYYKYSSREIYNYVDRKVAGGGGGGLINMQDYEEKTNGIRIDDVMLLQQADETIPKRMNFGEFYEIFSLAVWLQFEQEFNQIMMTDVQSEAVSTPPYTYTINGTGRTYRQVMIDRTFANRNLPINYVGDSQYINVDNYLLVTNNNANTISISITNDASNVYAGMIGMTEALELPSGKSVEYSFKVYQNGGSEFRYLIVTHSDIF